MIGARLFQNIASGSTVRASLLVKSAELSARNSSGVLAGSGTKRMPSVPAASLVALSAQAARARPRACDRAAATPARRGARRTQSGRNCRGLAAHSRDPGTRHHHHLDRARDAGGHEPCRRSPGARRGPHHNERRAGGGRIQPERHRSLSRSRRGRPDVRSGAKQWLRFSLPCAASTPATAASTCCARKRHRHVLRIYQDTHTRDSGKCLLEQFYPLAAQRLAANRHARDIAARPADARHEPQVYGVTCRPNDDRDRARCIKCGARGGSGVRNDHVNRDSHQFRCKTRQRIDVPLGETEIEDDGFPVHIAEIAKSLAESVEDGRRVVLGGGQDAYARHFSRLLCPCRDFDWPPGSRTAKKRDEIAPPHVLSPGRGPPCVPKTSSAPFRVAIAHELWLIGL